MENIKAFEKRVYLASPTMHGDELTYMKEAYTTNWMTTAGGNITAVEELVRNKIEDGYAVALSSGTSALHLAIKLANVKPGDTVFCTDLTFVATLNPILYEGGIPVFIDSEYDTWNMDPCALERAFEAYPDTKVVILANLYGTPAKLKEIAEICEKHGAILIEDAAESFGAVYCGKQTGTFGKYNVISFNGNKIITGSSGGVLVTKDAESADRARKWSTQSREQAPWYQHEEIGYNYRISNVIAGVVRGQFPYLEEHIALKKQIYMRYRDGFSDLPVSMNPYDEKLMEPNFWLSCMLIDRDAMCEQHRSDTKAHYIKEKGKTCPTEILELLDRFNIEGRPIWKPMHMQPLYAKYAFVTGDGVWKPAMGAASHDANVGEDLFHRGLCLPSDIKMTAEQQEVVIKLVRSCFE